MLKLFLFFLGVIISSFSVTFIIIYFNLLNMGYTFLEYIKFIFTRVECLSLFLGIILISFSIFKRKDKKHDLYL